ncbi:ABC transporter substrate-binding protein [Sporichthya sp.]|uniref:ABC transporter substrate-binding protein n=1 Tax=Sporichthya sp. TaxID=65475 RepID=UPI00181170F2|nr:ABC transporter substrate-binding protein [Sporichthya sp.]MBA3741838.1 ABC transporter substrate-binding protein [Sporichthya sp.]
MTAVVAAVAMMAGCGGTRVDQERILAAEGRTSGTSTDVGGTDTGTAAIGSTDVGAADTGAEASSLTPGVPAGNAPVTAPGSATNPAAAQPSKGKPAKDGAGAGAVSTANQPCTRALEPIVIGQVGAFSGVVGASIGNLRSGMSVWVKDVNARGGIECHPVRIVQRDDGSDPARTDANVKQLILTEKVVAFVGSGPVITISVVQRLAEQYKVPFIGGDASDLAWWNSQYLFPQGGISLASFAGAIKAASQATGAKKLGILYCVEATICSSIGQQAKKLAGQAEVELVVNKAASLTQTDFTAECQAMKSAGVNVAFFALDGSAVQRAIRNCKQLGFIVPVAVPSIAVNAETAQDPNLQQFGVFLGSSVLPFVDTASTAGRDFNKAYHTFAPGALIDDSSMRGWVSGKMLETALGKVSAQARAGTVTTALILQGLWTLKNETFGGLTSATTFAKGATAKITQCYYALRLTPEGFTSTLGGKSSCLPEPSSGAVESGEAR